MLTLLGHADTEAQPRSIHITHDGRWLIAAGQCSHRVRVHAIDARTGMLSARSSCAVGQTPSWVESVALAAGGGR